MKCIHALSGRRLGDEERLLLIFAARQEQLFWSFFGPSQTEETTVKGQTEIAVGGVKVYKPASQSLSYLNEIQIFWGMII